MVLQGSGLIGSLCGGELRPREASGCRGGEGSDAQGTHPHSVSLLSTISDLRQARPRIAGALRRGREGGLRWKTPARAPFLASNQAVNRLGLSIRASLPYMQNRATQSRGWDNPEAPWGGGVCGFSPLKGVGEGDYLGEGGGIRGGGRPEKKVGILHLCRCQKEGLFPCREREMGKSTRSPREQRGDCGRSAEMEPGGLRAGCWKLARPGMVSPEVWGEGGKHNTLPPLPWPN